MGYHKTLYGFGLAI